MHIEEAILAKKIACAFLNVYKDEFNDSYAHDCLELELFFKENYYFFVILQAPSISITLKKRAIREIIVSCKIKPLLEKLMIVLLEKGSINLICIVLKQLLTEYYKRNNIYVFNVMSSHELSNEQKGHIKKFIGKLSSPKCIVNFKIDSSLIVGLRIQSSHYLWERSIKKELLEISTHIAQKGMSW